MSGTGSAFGQAEYVAINPSAIASVLLGVASGLALLASIFLILPAVGLGCGLLAIRQIRQSNGTQTGVGFAIAGIVLSLVLGGIVVTNQGLAWAQTRASTRAIDDLLSRFGQEAKAAAVLGNTPQAAEKYDAMYDSMMTEAFRGRVDKKTFRARLQSLRVPRSQPGSGGVESIRWNGEPMEFQPVADTEFANVLCMSLVKLQGQDEPAREIVRLTNQEGSWKIDGLLRLFPDKKGNDAQDQ